jgi:hypothetical protein
MGIGDKRRKKGGVKRRGEEWSVALVLPNTFIMKEVLLGGGLTRLLFAPSCRMCRLRERWRRLFSAKASQGAVQEMTEKIAK